MVSAVAALAALFLLSWTLRRRRTLARRRQAAELGAVAALAMVAAAAGPSSLALHKLAGRLLMPIALIWLALLAMAWVRSYRGDVRGAAFSFALFVALGVFCNEYLAEMGLRALEQRFTRDPLVVAAEEERFDAIIVLGGGVKRGPVEGTYELGPPGDRVALAVRLYHAGRVSQLVTSGSPIEGAGKPFDSVDATTVLMSQMGVPADAIVPVRGARNTAEEAELIAELARERGWKRVGLISSAWHLRRATRLFERAGIEPTPLAADHRGDPVWNGAVTVIPSGGGAYLWHACAWEVLGAAVGR
jgi:uncharacterized SAM-binding protein YcdF (DUF218 family)